MKNRLYKLTTVFFAVLILGCSSDDKTVDEVFATVTNGAFLRIAATDGESLNLFDTSSTFTVDLEYSDENLNGDLLDRVDFFISFNDNNGPDDDSAGPVPFGTLAKSDFGTSQFGLPIATFDYSFGEALAALGLDQSQVMGGDAFQLDWTVFLTDGREFSAEDANGNIAAVGGFYSSPYQFTNGVVCLFDAPEFFAGTYLMTQLTGADPFYSAQTFGTQTVELMVTSGTQRTFDFNYYPGIFDAGYTMTLDFVCDKIQMQTSGGLGCGSAILSSTGDDPTFFDDTLMDDDSIVLNISDWSDDGGCGAPPYPITVMLTKM